jgi:branched-chain amino acid transport system ATP-binding protein
MAVQEVSASQLLKVTDLAFAYRKIRVIEGIDFHLNRGEICSVIGPNGAGKTTFLNLLSGKLVPNRGEIVYRNRSITRLSPEARRHLGLARSFQITNIFLHKTVYENVRFAVQGLHKKRYAMWRPIDDYRDIEKETEELIHLMNLQALKNARCLDLAYAEQRLVELALTLAGGAEVLLLDEPTAGLSLEESRYVAALIRRLVDERGVSIVFIEHDMDIVFSISDRIAVMYYGKLLVTDTPERVRQNEQVQKIYLGEMGGESVQ